MTDLYKCPKCGYECELDDDCDCDDYFRCCKCMDAYLEIIV